MSSIERDTCIYDSVVVHNYSRFSVHLLVINITCSLNTIGNIFLPCNFYYAPIFMSTFSHDGSGKHCLSEANVGGA